MSAPLSTAPPGERWPSWAVLVFLLVAVLGIFYAKWEPYYFKAFLAAHKHSIGASIISGKLAAPPTASFAAAWSYALSYFNAIWVALVVGLLVGSGIQALLPPDWLLKLFGTAGLRSRMFAALLAVPSMMCTCCSAPLAVALNESRVSTGATLAYWIGNPVLNPATIIFMGFVLGWRWAILRMVLGIVLVAG